MMSTHKLTAGDGYLYLIRQTAAADGSDKGRASLSDYYSAKGESPGRWVGNGLPALGAPAGRELTTDTARDLWHITAGSQVTEDQMKALFGLGLHPNAAAIVAHLIQNSGLAKGPALEAAKLGRPFRINSGETTLQRRLAVAYRDHNLANGDHWNKPIPDAERAAMRTAVARDMFAQEYGREPADDRELSGFIARNTRELTTSVAGYDLTFTPVKSVSALWAIAPLEVSKRIEAAHDRAVADALAYLQTHAAFTRTGAQGVAQIDTEGFIAAVFTHRDSRAGDPGLHSHVAVSNKVRGVGADGIPRWLALDGRPLFKATVAASELYNTRIEGYLGQTLGLRFADRGDEQLGKRPVREIVGVPAELTELWSSRRGAIDQRYAELTKRFHTAHGREPTTTEAIALSQQATLETRAAKHEPRSLAEQRQQWRTQAIELLGGQAQLSGMLAAVLSRRQVAAEVVTEDWISRQAGLVIATVSEGRSRWQRTHVYAEAQRRLRATGHAGDPSLADRITNAALAEPLSLLLAPDREAEMGEPAALRRRDGTSVYSAHGTRQYTSSGIVAAERRILAAARRRDGRCATRADVDMALARQRAHRRELNDGQAALVREMACSGARVALALAPAGTGKTTAMATLARAWEENGGHVIGLAPSASAAEVLRDELDVDATDTIAKYLWLHDNPGHTDDPTRGWFDRINADTLLIVDEAGRAGTLDLDRVIGHAVARGASVRLVGDDCQLASISAGGVVRDIAHETGALTLTQVLRFSSRSEAPATLALRDGDPAGLGFYIDNHRVHVGADETAADLAYRRWQADRDNGLDALLLAPTNDSVALLNERARLDRLTRAIAQGSPAAAAQVRLADQLIASAGDIVCTRRNARRLRIGPTDYVRNGYRWRIENITPTGGLLVSDLSTGRRVTLPADYVADHVTLGYATTIDAAQGVTADTCHVVGSDTLTRQMLYVALTRGRHRNDIYLSTAETDPHRILTPKATHPDTAVDVLARALARDDAQISATNEARRAADPRLRLGPAALRYLDAIGSAAAEQLGADAMRAIDSGADTILPGLTGQAGWPVLRQHLAMLAVGGDDPLHRLAGVAGDRDFDGSADPAAVLDWRLDHSGAHSIGSGPLRWLPAIPAALAADPTWGPYLQRRHTVVEELADTIRRDASRWTVQTAPRWARPFVGAHARLAGEIAVFRAAAGVSEDDSRVAGPEQNPVRARAIQRLLEQQAAAVLGRAGTDTGRWNAVIDGVDSHIRRDPFWPQLAEHLTTAARTGVDIRQLLADVAGAGPLPDELPAAALWWRLAGTLSPATVDTPHSALRPAWIPELHNVFGTALAETIAADPAWPGLVAAVAAADPQRWTPQDLLWVAAEHLRDADRHQPIRPDEYARLLTYSIDLFTIEAPFGRDVPTQDEPPLTPEEHEELRHRFPDPHHPEANEVEVPALVTDVLTDAAALAPPDPHGYNYEDDLGGLRFDDLPARRPAAQELQPALIDVRALRRQVQQASDRLADLETQVRQFFGPAMRAAMPRIRELRERAQSDRPHLVAIQHILAEWADADEQDAAAQRQSRWAERQVERLRAEGADDLDIAAAEADARLRRLNLPATTPAERFYDAFTAATTARVEAAGGADRIVTDEDVDAVIADATQADQAALQAARAKLRRLTRDLDRAEAAAAAAFAAAEMRSADHVVDQQTAMETELAVLEVAGGFDPDRALVLPRTATENLPEEAALGLTQLAGSAFTVTPVRAADRAGTLEAMRVLRAAASAQRRNVLWCSPTHDMTERLPDAEVADTVAVLTDAHRRLADGTWRLPAGSLVVIDQASAANPETIADIASRADDSNARLILLDPDDQRWPPGPSAALLRLLHEDLPWAVTLSVGDSPEHRHPHPPDLHAALIQASRLDPQVRTPEVQDAVTRCEQLHREHRSSYRVQMAWTRDNDNDLARDDDRGL